jgi:Winged helix domain
VAKNTINIVVQLGTDGPVKEFKGRPAWALANLLAAGGPRWSDYIFKLKRNGINIETVHESHGGNYAGHHARYVFWSPVTVISEEATHG